MPKLARYHAGVGGNKTMLQLNEADAKRLRATPVKTKKRSAANKSVKAPTGAPERPAGNASTEDWHAYAKAVGVDVDPAAGRDDVVAAVDAAA